MIGKDAKQEKTDSFTDTFKRTEAIGKLYTLAEALATEERPLLNQKQEVETKESGDIKVHTFSNVPVSDQHLLVLGIGNPKTGFYQVPIIKIAEDIDVIVSGTIDDKGKSTKFKKQRKLSEHSYEAFGLGLAGAKKVYGVALVPKSGILGEEMIVGGHNNHKTFSQGMYNMIVNGFAMDRKVIGSGGYRLPQKGFTPLMFPDADGNERYLKLTDILSGKEVAQLEKGGVFPGLTFVAGQFQKYEPVFRLNFHSKSIMDGGMKLMGGDMLLGDNSRDAGRVGVDVGSESNVKYGTINGEITGINGVLALNFIGVEDNAPIGKVRTALEKLYN